MDSGSEKGAPSPARSKYDPIYVAAFYDRDPEREWLRLVRSPIEEIKLHVHEHYLRTHLTAGMRVLEIGAGPGRFAKTLHELGAQPRHRADRRLDARHGSGHRALLIT